MKLSCIYGTTLLTLVGFASAVPGAGAQEYAFVGAAPILVELFTSEGCSSCPPADDVLQQLHGMHTRTGALIVGISEHVTYWDRLGWKDPFSDSQVTQRQNAYSNSFHLDSVYTPQMIVDGRSQIVGSDAVNVRAAIERAGSAAHSARLHIDQVRIVADGLKLMLALKSLPRNSADLYVVVAQDMASTPVRSGENSGRILTHVSIARSLSRVGVADGNSAMTIRLPAAELQSSVGQKRHLVVFAQARGTGPVLAVDSIAF